MHLQVQLYCTVLPEFIDPVFCGREIDRFRENKPKTLLFNPIRTQRRRYQLVLNDIGRCFQILGLRRGRDQLVFMLKGKLQYSARNTLLPLLLLQGWEPNFVLQKLGRIDSRFPLFRGRKHSFRGIPSSAEEPIPKLGTEGNGMKFRGKNQFYETAAKVVYSGTIIEIFGSHVLF